MTSAREVLQLSRAIAGGSNGHVAVLKAYLDESGVHDGSPAVTVGAYVARPSVWSDWTKAWNLRKRPIRVFHANKCANLEGEFAGWERGKRDEYVAGLLKTIPEHKLAAFAAGMRLNDYRSVCETHPHLADVIRTPYAVCLQWVVQDILSFLNRLGDTQTIAFFHEVNAFKAEALQCFEFVQRFDGNRRKMSLTFGTKSDYVPLQAADALAYEANKRTRNPNGPKRRAWAALNPSGKLRSFRYFDKTSLLDIANGLTSHHETVIARSW